MASLPHSNDGAGAPPGATSAEPKNPVAPSHNGTPSDPATSDITKPADGAAAAVNGTDAASSTAPASNGDGANGSTTKVEAAVAEATPVDTVMTGALPLDGDQSKATALPPKSAESAEKDGLKQVTEVSKIDKPAPTTGVADSAETEKNASPAELASENKPSTAASTTSPMEKEDVEMKDAGSPDEPSVPASAVVTSAAAVPDVSGMAGATAPVATAPGLATPATVAAGATGGKRKADSDIEEPAAKKPKGALSRAVDKAKEVVHDVKEKAKPGRKPGKKAKKEIAPPPVGRTERKTRSQARSE